ncbi:MAG: N-acetylmuramoyl-L-alanine amidase family protein [bacterium]
MLRHESSKNRLITLRWLTAMVVAFVILAALNTHERQLRQRVWAQASLVAPQIVVLDPGHGGIDTGAAGPNGVTEKDVTLPVCLYLKEYLTLSGARVLLTRQDDKELSEDFDEDLQLRVDLVKQSRATLFLSIHGNSFPGPSEYGAQTFFCNNHHESERLARCIQAELKRLEPLGENYREVQSGDFYVLRNSPVAAALVEIGFLSHPQEELLLADPAYQKQLAWHMFSALVAFWRGEGVSDQSLTPVSLSSTIGSR